MLCLSRKLHERVRLTCPGGVEIWVQVLDIDRGKNRLGFQAPQSVGIHR